MERIHEQKRTLENTLHLGKCTNAGKDKVPYVTPRRCAVEYTPIDVNLYMDGLDTMAKYSRIHLSICFVLFYLLQFLLSALSYGTYRLYEGTCTTIVTMGLNIYTKLYTRNIACITVTLHPKTLCYYVGCTQIVPYQYLNTFLGGTQTQYQ